MRAKQPLIMRTKSTNLHSTVRRAGVVTLIIHGSCWRGATALPLPRHGWEVGRELRCDVFYGRWRRSSRSSDTIEVMERRLNMDGWEEVHAIDAGCPVLLLLPYLPCWKKYFVRGEKGANLKFKFKFPHISYLRSRYISEGSH